LGGHHRSVFFKGCQMQINVVGVGLILVIAIVVALVISVFVMARNSQKSAKVQKQMADTLAKMADDKKRM
jgi:preprotein translocase subunit YajC